MRQCVAWCDLCPPCTLASSSENLRQPLHYILVSLSNALPLLLSFHVSFFLSFHFLSRCFSFFSFSLSRSLSRALSFSHSPSLYLQTPPFPPLYLFDVFHCQSACMCTHVSLVTLSSYCLPVCQSHCRSRQQQVTYRVGKLAVQHGWLSFKPRDNVLCKKQEESDTTLR